MTMRHTLFPSPVALLALVAATACSSGGGTGRSALSPALDMSTTAPSPEPRVGLAPGSLKKVPSDPRRSQPDTNRRTVDQPAAEAIWNLKLISATPKSPRFLGVTNSDLAFRGNYVFQGNYDGYQVWDISNPRKPSLKDVYFCPASQSDVSVYNNLLFVSAEAGTARLDCGGQGIADTVSQDRIRGIRIFDGTDVSNPKYIGNVQTCRGSHTHTIVEDPKDKENIYIYISGNSAPRSPTEVPGCSQLAPEEGSSEAFKIEVIQIPLAHPEQSRVINKPAILADLTPAPRNSGRTRADSVDNAANAAAAAARGGAGRGGRGGAGGGGRGRGNQPPRGPTQCHDITVYPAIGRAGGACGGYGLLLDISDAKNPKRIGAVADSNFSFWHSATFNNDGTKVLFTDEWGGGGAPRCRSTDRPEWGADALFTLQGNQMSFKSYYKVPAAQTALENCVAHNGSLLPIPGRDVMVQGWYQGGISVFDWTDIAHPKEIAFHDRGPLSGERMVSGGSWSVYWYNGYIVSSEIARGLDIFELQPSGFLTQNEIDAAKSVHLDQLNTQGQPKYVWPPSFSLTRAYLDQLERDKSQSAARIASARDGLTAAEKLSGAARKAALDKLAEQLHTDATSATDQRKAHAMAGSVNQLAAATK